MKGSIGHVCLCKSGDVGLGGEKVVLENGIKLRLQTRAIPETSLRFVVSITF